jgi:type II secretory ATPase GspE/PulE/Tfp pilus assembly ATPase PilB-like protein
MKIGEALIKEGLISLEELKVALEEQKKTSERLGDILLKMSFISPEEMAPFLAKHFHLAFIKLKEIYKEIEPEVVSSIPEELAYRFTLIPIVREDNTLTVAMFDPLDVVALDTIRLKTGFKIKRVVACEKDIIEAIEYCYHQLPRLAEHIQDFVKLGAQAEKRGVLDFERLRIEASDPPVVQFVNSLIIQAVNARSSDIHLQPKQDAAELRFRIDGVLYNIDSPPKNMLPAITTRIKILADLDIAERRLPQDGRFKVKLGANEIDVRVSCFPTIYGESIVLRLLDTSSPLLGLSQLGFSSQDLERYKHLIAHAYGLILVSGPTGSGKTTTLYTSLNEIKSSTKKMITLEDPVEYRLPFIQQSQINAQIGFDFARGLRSILRQDPDIIMVGEIRDRETAEIAIHAALTGHLVFSTLHTNDAAGAAVRLINMGVEPFLITSSLIGILSQRLVRCICSDCRQDYSASREILRDLSLEQEITHFSRGKGCAKCLNSGYRGRVGIFELLIPDEQIRDLIIQRASSDKIKRQAQKNGMKTLRESGIEKLKQEITTPEEVLRVTQEAEEF